MKTKALMAVSVLLLGLTVGLQAEDSKKGRTTETKAKSKTQTLKIGPQVLEAAKANSKLPYQMRGTRTDIKPEEVYDRAEFESDTSVCGSVGAGGVSLKGCVGPGGSSLQTSVGWGVSVGLKASKDRNGKESTCTVVSGSGGAGVIGSESVGWCETKDGNKYQTVGAGVGIGFGTEGVKGALMLESTTKIKSFESKARNKKK